MNEEWFLEITNGIPIKATCWQIATIGSLLNRSVGYNEQEEIRNKLYDISELEAEELIIYLKENETKTDPVDQFDYKWKNGFFN